MTEIKIEKKNIVWPWILLVLAVIAVLVYFLVYDDYKEVKDEDKQTSELVGPQRPDLISVKENNSTVAAYVNFIESGDNKMTLDHEYTNEALYKLTEAVYAIAGEVGYDVKADLEKVKEYAEKITNDPYETTHADNIRSASEILTNALQNIQKAKFPGLANEVAELRNASEAIKPAILTLDQKNEVKAFFSKAANLLRKMN